DAVLVIPAVGAAVLVLLPGYWLSARLNVLTSLATLLAALSLLVERPAPGRYLFVDDLNITFVVLATFVGFTTSAFSASYIGHELEIGRLTPRYLRFYHAMYQTLMFAMNLGLLANNIGLMWVAIDLPTLTTFLMAGNAAAVAPCPLMVSMGLLSLIFAGFMLYRRRDIKRMFAYSSIEHMGLITFAFGMGGPLANFGGLLHMTMHSLTKSAIFFAVGHIAQAKGTQRIAEIRGLTESHPVL